MSTVLISNLAPIKDPEAAFFVAVIRAFERHGHECLFWSAAYHRRLAPWFLPSHWGIDEWPHYYRELPATPATLDRAKWLPRVARLIKQGALPAQTRLETVARVSTLLLDALQPDLFVSWNTLCPHTGILADLGRTRGMTVQLMERGPLPQTWYWETGGLVGHSILTGVALETLVAPERWDEVSRLGADYLRTSSFQTFNNYPQAPVDLDRLEQICAAHPRRIAFFPPDDGTLGFVPVDHEDRRRTLPGYRDSFAAAKALARSTDAAVIFKAHPSFAGLTFDTGGAPNLHVVNTDFRLVLDRADVVASTGSGLPLIGLAAGKPFLNLAREWLCGKGIAYEAQEPSQLSDAVHAALARRDFGERQRRFTTYIGFLLSEYLVSPPEANAAYLRPDAAVSRLLRTRPLANSAVPGAVVERRASILVPAYGEFLEGQKKLHVPPADRVPATVRTDVEGVAAVCVAEPERMRILDFDHTLFLGNSTELFLATARPRWLAYLIALAADEIHRLVSRGRENYLARRDQVRVLSVVMALPWSLLWWRRQAVRHSGERLNRALWEAAQGGPVHVASLGFRELITPLLRPLGSDVPLTASPLFAPLRNLRRAGKVAALERALSPATVAGAIGVTDSHEDIPLLRAVARPFLLTFANPPLPTPAYVPLRYTAEGKYPGKRILVSQHFGEDFVVLLLAYAWTWDSIGALLPLFLAFFTIYDIGYFENDFHAAKREKSPVLAPQSKAFAGYRISLAWIWAALFSVAGVWLLPGDFREHLTWWAGVLIGTRLVFAAYNRVTPLMRLWLYPVLQLAKGFAFVILLPVTWPGGVLLVAQAMRQITNYNVYRTGGDTKKFLRQTHRAVIFIALTAVLLAGTQNPGPFLTVQTALIAAWLIFRVLRERFGPWPMMVRKAVEALGRGLRPAHHRPRAIIFGAGLGGEQAARALASSWEIAAFCDNDPGKRGKTLRGLPIISPADLPQWGDCVVHIAAYYHYHDIYTQLRRLGLPEERVRFFQLEHP